ncbi:MAG: AEC family transporter [Opitutales bacterium]
MHILNSLLPILILIVFGKALSRSGFFAEGFFKELNRLAYFWGLPAILIYKIAEVDLFTPAGRGILYTLLIVIFSTMALAYLCAPLLRVPAASLGAFVQGSFRGNLAFVGFPVVYFAGGEDALGLGMLASGFCILVYNLSSVLILLLHGSNRAARSWRTVWRQGISNPLILACLVGFLINLSGFEIPVMLNRSLEALGQIALPLALIGLGAGLQFDDLKGRIDLAAIAAFINVGVSPALGFFVGRALGLDSQSLAVAVIFLACPTAIFSYVLAEMLGNDAATARSIVVLSTLFSIVSLSVAVAMAPAR